MKWIGQTVLATLLLTGAIAVHAQRQNPPATPQQTPRQQDVERRATQLRDRSELLYEKLHGLSEFQEWLAIQKQMAELQREYDAAGAPPVPAKPATPQK